MNPMNANIIIVYSLLCLSLNAFTLTSTARRRSSTHVLNNIKHSVVLASKGQQSNIAEVSQVAVTSDDNDMEESIYTKIGIREDQLALGVNAREFFQYIGTRQELIEKTMRDIPLDLSRAETEVDKFLLDAEAINMYIAFQKKKEEDPNFVVPEAKKDEGLFSFRNLITIYIGYVAASEAPGFFKRWVEEKAAAGEWNGSGIAFIDEWLSKSSEKLNPDVVSDAIKSASDVVQTISDKIN